MKNGCVLGYICDVEIDIDTGSLQSIVIPGRPRFFGFFGREEDIIIPWNEIKVIGQETVLVNSEPPVYKGYNKKSKFRI